MSNQTASILRKALQNGERPYNIITFDTHERYQTQLAKTGHNFYSFKYDGGKDWVNSYAPKPSNYYTFPKNSVIYSLGIDFILSQSKFGQFQMANKISEYFKLPIILLEHTLPIPTWPDQQLAEMRNMRGDFNVFISDYSAKQWGIFPYTVIKHSVDTELFKPDMITTTGYWEGETIVKEEPVARENYILSVANGYRNRDYALNFSGWERITKGFNVKLVGDNPGLSTAAPSVQDLVKEYQKAGIFLNTSTVSPVPTSMLEAMSCGCAVVSTATCMIPEIIKNGVNGFLSNDENELRDYLHVLTTDHKLRDQLGTEARNTIISDFSEERFITQWNNLFNKAYGAKR